MEPSPKVIGSRISQKMMFSVAILGLSFSRLNWICITYHKFFCKIITESNLSLGFIWNQRKQVCHFWWDGAYRAITCIYEDPIGFASHKQLFILHTKKLVAPQ